MRRIILPLFVALIASVLSPLSGVGAQQGGSISTPTNLRATNTAGGAISLSWNASSGPNGVLGYRVFRDGVEVGNNPQVNSDVVSVGDIALCNNEAQRAGARATAALTKSLPGTILLLGDQTQGNGSQNEHNCFDESWGSLKSRAWAIAGNHEYNTPNATPHYNYWGARAGNAGQGYFAVRVGAWNFIGLNTTCWKLNDGCGVGSRQYDFVKNSLEASTAPCTAILGHHPRWSSAGSQNNEWLAPIYQLATDHGVELYLSGHNHQYKRYAKLNNNLSSSDTAVRQLVVGTGGFSKENFQAGSPTPVVRNADSYGVLDLDLRPTSFTSTFKPIAGDTFTDRIQESCHGPNSNSIAFTDYGLAPGSSHNYRVVAYDANGNTSAATTLGVTAGAGTTRNRPGSTNATLNATPAAPVAAPPAAPAPEPAPVPTPTTTAPAPIPPVVAKPASEPRSGETVRVYSSTFDAGVVDKDLDGDGDYIFGTKNPFLGLGQQAGPGTEMRLVIPFDLNERSTAAIDSAARVRLQLRVSAITASNGAGVDVVGLNDTTWKPTASHYAAPARLLARDVFRGANSTITLDITRYAKEKGASGHLLLRVQLNKAQAEAAVARYNVGQANAPLLASKPTLLIG